MPESSAERVVSGGEEPLKWFAMGAPYRNEFKVQAALIEKGVECFVPVVTRQVVVRGRKLSRKEPAVSNLLFVHAAESNLQRIKASIPRLQYKIITEGDHTCKVTVRDSEMENFILFLKNSAGLGVKFRTPGEMRFKMGDRVKIVGGVFEGVSGTLVKPVRGKSRTLVVEIEGVVSASVEISPDFVALV